MKKATALILALVMCFSLCACGNDQPVKAESTIPATEPIIETTIAKEPDVYDSTNVESILAFITSEAAKYSDGAEKEAALLVEALGDTYEAYVDNKDSIAAYYDSTMTNAASLYASVQTASIDYCKCIAANGLGDYDDWDDAMEDLYEAWDDAYEDFYDAWDDSYEDIYEKCDDLLEDAADKVSYEEYSDAWSVMYDAHSDAWSAMYDAHSAAWSTSYDNHSAIWSGFYDNETDVEAILKAAAEKEAKKAAEAATQPEETETQPAVIEEETQPAETEATVQPTEVIEAPASGLRQDFKDAMDAYEAFYAEYCEFLAEYKENPTDLTLLAKYGELVMKAQEMEDAFKKWESEDLNDEELKYYLDVQNRVMKLLVDVM